MCHHVLFSSSYGDTVSGQSAVIIKHENAILSYLTRQTFVVDVIIILSACPSLVALFPCPEAILSNSIQLSYGSFLSFSTFLLHLQHDLALHLFSCRFRCSAWRHISTAFHEDVPNPSSFPNINASLKVRLISCFFPLLFIPKFLLPFDFKDIFEAAVTLFYHI